MESVEQGEREDGVTRFYGAPFSDAAVMLEEFSWDPEDREFLEGVVRERAWEL